MIRCINERHAHEQELAYLSQFDGLTGEINRWHLSDHSRKLAAGSDPLAAILRLPAGRDRQSRARQRDLWLRHRRRGHRRGGQTPAHQDAGRGLPWPLLRKQIRLDPAQLLARGNSRRGRPPAGGGARRCGDDDGRAGLGHGDDRRRHARRAMRATSTKFSRARRKRSTAPRPSGRARSLPISRVSSATRSARKTSARPTRS